MIIDTQKVTTVLSLLQLKEAVYQGHLSCTEEECESYMTALRYALDAIRLGTGDIRPRILEDQHRPQRPALTLVKEGVFAVRAF